MWSNALECTHKANPFFQHPCAPSSSLRHFAFPHQRSSVSSPSVPPLECSAHLCCLSSTSHSPSSLHYRLCSREELVIEKMWCSHFSFNRSPPLQIHYRIKWDTAVICPTRTTHAHKHASAHRHNPLSNISHLNSYYLTMLHWMTGILYIKLTRSTDLYICRAQLRRFKLPVTRIMPPWHGLLRLEEEELHGRKDITPDITPITQVLS